MYDGDKGNNKGIGSLEANTEMDEVVRSKRMILNIYGSNVRTTNKEAIQTLYALTKKTG